jgi:glycosyltransferase involved in cell wall biosynthesis
LKEIRAALEAGYKVSVMKFDYNNWTNDYEDAIEKKLEKVEWIKISGRRKPLLPWLAATLTSFISSKLLTIAGSNARLISYALDKRSYLLNKQLKKLNPNYNIVIAHNPGAFWASCSYATNNKIPLGIDIEDYHPGEYCDKKQSGYMKLLMDKVLPAAAYITAASPLILKYSEKSNAENHKVINNVFSLQQQPSFKNIAVDNKLKLFWFSQHIGLDRGLQDIIAAMNLVDSYSVDLTLVGNCNEDVKVTLQTQLTSSKHAIIFKQPIAETALIEEASNHHIGLALESGANLNRNLCLTNKIFIYLLAGNAIIASDTDAQKDFAASNPESIIIYKVGDAQALANILHTTYANTTQLEEMRKSAYNAASSKYNWEAEQQVFLSLVNNNFKRA